MLMCEVNKEEVPFTGIVGINGYGFGDRLLEDVIFEIKVTDGVMDESSIRVADSCKAYFSQLNPNWIEKALEYAKENDLFDCIKTEQIIDEVEIDGRKFPGEIWQTF